MKEVYLYDIILLHLKERELIIMPCMITHKIFAEKTLLNLNKTDIVALIEKNAHLYYIGSNGPDILFYHNTLPWQSHLSQHVSKLGNRMHSMNINAFYEKAFELITQQTNLQIKERMMAYILGHLAHWALDKSVHPYIFYRTGATEKIHMDYHHRIESDIDLKLLHRIKGVEAQDYRSYQICEYDNDMLQAIARIYVPIAKEVFHVDLKVNDIRKALDNWKTLQQLFQDTTGKKELVLSKIEKILNIPWRYSGYLLKQNEESYDVLNEEHQVWCHPCDQTIQSNQSFMELFDEGVVLATTLLEKAYGCMEYGADVENVLALLQNQSYDTSMPTLCEMKYFDIIYK